MNIQKEEEEKVGDNMPNWCWNELTITGDSNSISKFKKKAAEKPPYWDYDDDYSKSKLHFSNFITPPIDLVYEEQTLDEPFKRRKYDGDVKRSMEIIMLVSTGRGEEIIPDNLYDWEFINWGCKWGANDAYIKEEREDTLVYIFDTPWDPPREFVVKVSKMYPKLRFHLVFDEPGNLIGGNMTAMKGEKTQEKYLQAEEYENEYREQDEESEEDQG